AEAAALLILELEQTSGKLAKSFFGLAAFGDVDKSADHGGNGAVAVKLRHRVSQYPEHLTRFGTAPTNYVIENRFTSFEHTGHRTHGKRDFGAILPNRNQIKL